MIFLRSYFPSGVDLEHIHHVQCRTRFHPDPGLHADGRKTVVVKVIHYMYCIQGVIDAGEKPQDLSPAVELFSGRKRRNKNNVVRVQDRREILVRQPVEISINDAAQVEFTVS